MTARRPRPFDRCLYFVFDFIAQRSNDPSDVLLSAYEATNYVPRALGVVFLEDRIWDEWFSFFKKLWNEWNLCLASLSLASMGPRRAGFAVLAISSVVSNHGTIAHPKYNLLAGHIVSREHLTPGLGAVLINL